MLLMPFFLCDIQSYEHMLHMEYPVAHMVDRMETGNEYSCTDACHNHPSAIHPEQLPDQTRKHHSLSHKMIPLRHKCCYNTETSTLRLTAENDPIFPDAPLNHSYELMPECNMFSPALSCRA